MSEDNKPEYEHFTKKTEKQHYHEIKGLPIRMSDRRVLYEDVQAIYNFEREIRGQGAREKTIPFFRMRLLWNTFMFQLKTFNMWEDSLREIEIQRGTLTANVFYFIKYTLFFNLLISLIVLVGIVLPHLLIFIGEAQDPAQMCPSGFDGNSTAMGASITKMEFAECCYKRYLESQLVTITNTKLRWLIQVSEFLGGTSGWLSTPFFYGYYTTEAHTTLIKRDFGKLLPLLYVASVVAVLVVSFCILVNNIADGIQEIVRNKDGDVCVFSELIFCGYHHRSLNENEARFRRKLWLHNLHVAIKEAKSWAKKAKLTRRILVIRVIVMISTTAIILMTAGAIYFLSDKAYDEVNKLKDSQELMDILKRMGISFLPSVAVSVSNIILPNVFIKVSIFERYSLEQSTTFILYRSLCVRLLSVVVAVIRVFDRNYACGRVIEYTCNTCPAGVVAERNPCWESVLAREFYKILFTELVVKSFLTFVVDPFRRMLKKVCFRIKFMRSVGTLRFNVIRHSIDIINVQVMCWIGFYFAPTYPFAVCMYLTIMFYVKKFAVLSNCVGIPESHKVTRTTTIFLSGKLVSFLLVLIFIMVVLGEWQPSRGCGPFASFYVPWSSVQSFMSVEDESSILFVLVENLLSLSVYVPLAFVSITFFYHFYSRRNRIQDTAESVKDLIYMENQDKQYLANKLMQLRSINQKQNYYDPVSIYDSEKRFIVSSNKRPNLDSQWKEMKNASLPYGTTPGIQRGALSQQMKKHAAALAAISSTSTAGSRKTTAGLFKKQRKKSQGKKQKKKRRKREEDDDSPASHRVGVKGKRRRKLNQLLNKIIGKPYTMDSSSSGSISETETDGGSKSSKKRPRRRAGKGSGKSFVWDKTKKKKVEPFDFNEFHWSEIPKHRHSGISSGSTENPEVSVIGTEDSPDAMKALNTGNEKELEEKKKLAKAVMEDKRVRPLAPEEPEKSNTGGSESLRGKKGKRFAWDADKNPASQSSGPLNSVTQSGPQKAKSVGGMGSRPEQTEENKPSQGKNQKTFAWDAKNQGGGGGAKKSARKK